MARTPYIENRTVANRNVPICHSVADLAASTPRTTGPPMGASDPINFMIA
jgi:hypothetical protein